MTIQCSHVTGGVMLLLLVILITLIPYTLPTAVSFLLVTSTDSEFTTLMDTPVDNEEEDSGREYMQIPTSISYQQRLAESNDNGNSSLDGAPRTFAGEYNVLDPQKKYFLYSPSGGMGNQIIELTNACGMSRKMNRTLIVPQLGSHSNMWYGYEHLTEESIFPMDRILDFPHLSRFCDALPINLTIKTFTERVAPVTFEIFLRYRQYWTLDVLLDHVRPQENNQVVFLHGPEMWHKWFSPSEYSEVMRHVRFSPYLRWRVLEIARVAFNGERFNAMHIRLGDYSSRWPESVTDRARTIALRPKQYPLKNRTLPLYVATDEPGSKSLSRLRSENRVTTINQLPKYLVKGFAQVFVPEIRLDMEGVLDQLLCACAHSFVPISWSTFSQQILIIRKNKEFLFPELKGIVVDEFDG